MDPISHAVFGGTIIHALFGKTFGKKVTVYGLVASTLPDADIIVQYIPGVDPLWASFFHRTITHSIPFVLLVAPILGRVFSRTPWGKKISWQRWWLITLIALLSHIFLDWMTTYGVRSLWPFVDYGFEANIISVIDLFFTLPLLGIIIWYLIQGGKNKSLGWTRFIGVTFASVYLSMMALLQSNLKSSIASDMSLAGVQHNRIFAAPQILQPFLWYGIVELPDGSYKTTYTSVFDTKPRIYENTYGYHSDAAPLERENPVLRQLIARSHGWYTISSQGPNTTFSDLRFGKLLGRDKQNRGNYMFQYVVSPTSISQSQQSFSQPFAFVREQHWRRVWGN